ncbi:ankyrin repeat domain-containing protein [Propionibacteriaceae bacterium Y1685]|uniref:ankyrin repeat domain-containing protein n=1 Tax=Microlunatus sp. Y1700 TaxID=3418487 RepID=UPI003B778F0E
MTGQQPADEPTFTEEELAFLHTVIDLARQGETEQLLGLVDQGIPVNLTDQKGDSLLILASYHGHNALAEGLVARGADVNRINARSQTAITCAVFRQNVELVRFLLAHGADPLLGEVNALATTEMFGLPDLKAIITEHLR